MCEHAGLNFPLLALSTSIHYSSCNPDHGSMGSHDGSISNDNTLLLSVFSNALPLEILHPVDSDVIIPRMFLAFSSSLTAAVDGGIPCRDMTRYMSKPSKYSAFYISGSWWSANEFTLSLTQTFVVCSSWITYVQTFPIAYVFKFLDSLFCLCC